MRKNLLFVFLTAVTLLVVSCTKQELKKNSLTETSSVASVVNTNSSSIEDPALVLAKSAALANTTYIAGSAHNKSGGYVVRNDFSNNVRIQSADVWFMSASSTETIPAGGINNLGIYFGNVQYGSTVSPNLNGVTTINNINFEITPSVSSLVSLFCDFPLESRAFGFITKIQLRGINLVTGQPVATSIIVGQTITVTIPQIEISFKEALSSPSQYIACGLSGNEGASFVTYNVASNSPIIVTGAIFDVAEHYTVASMRIGGVTAATTSNQQVVFSGLNIPVPLGGAGTNITVFQNYPSINGPGGLSGVFSKVTLRTVIYTSALSGQVFAKNTNLSSKSMKLVGSKPIVSINTDIHTGLTLGQRNKFCEITVSADAHGDIALNVIGFVGTISGISPNSFSYGNVEVYSNGILIPSTTFSDHTFPVSIGVILSNYQIPAGSTKTFQFYSVLTGIPTGSFMSLTTALVPEYFKWTDVAGGGVGSAENGVLIKDFPGYSSQYILYQ